MPYFYSHFPEFSPKISSNLLNYVKIVDNGTVDFILKTKKFVNYFVLIFVAQTLAKYFKIQPFSSKIPRNKLI